MAQFGAVRHCNRLLEATMAYYMVHDSNPSIDRPIGVIRAKNPRIASMLMEIIIEEEADWRSVGSILEYISKYITYTVSSKKALDRMRITSCFNPDLTAFAVALAQKRRQGELVHH